jgi:phage gpG-like protein
MSGITLRLKTDGSPIGRHLASLQQLDATQFQAARREIGEFLLGDIQDCFDRQKLADGSPMPQSQAAIKRRGKTLIDHHHLYDSYVYQLTAGGVEVGSDMVYAAINHFGGKTGRGHKTEIKSRPVMGLDGRRERDIGDYLVAAITRAQPGAHP